MCHNQIKKIVDKDYSHLRKMQGSFGLCYDQALDNDGMALQCFPNRLRSERLCLKAVQQNGMALEFVPVDEVTDEIYLEAVKNNGLALDLIPKEKRTDEICLEAVKSDNRAIEFVPYEKRSKEIYEIALTNYPDFIKYIPKEQLTYDMCLKAVKSSNCNIRYIPDKFCTQEIYETSIDYNPFNLKDMFDKSDANMKKHREEKNRKIDVPDSYEKCLELVRKDCEALKAIPENMRTKELCLESVKANLKSVGYLFQNEYSQEIYEEIIKQYPLLKKLIKDDMSILENFMFSMGSGPDWTTLLWLKSKATVYDCSVLNCQLCTHTNGDETFKAFVPEKITLINDYPVPLYSKPNYFSDDDSLADLYDKAIQAFKNEQNFKEKLENNLKTGNEM